MNKKKMMMFEILSASLGGGGGADVSVVTATAPDVDEGKIFVDNTGEQVVGTSTYKADYIALSTDINNLNNTLEPVLLGDGSDTNVYANVSNVTATASDVAQGKVFVNNTGAEVTGTASSGGTIPQDVLDIIQRPSNLLNFTVPSGITKLGSRLFQSYYLDSITLANTVTEIANLAFLYSDLINITFSNTLTTIGERAFYGCTRLTGITLPASLETIDDSAFEDCMELPIVTFLGTPTSIGSNVFSGCTALTTIRVPWQEGEVSGAPWGAVNSSIIYGYTPA